MAAQGNRPFAIQLEVEFLDRLSEPVRDGKAKSVSDIIRAALERFDLSKVVVVRPSQLLISVRLPDEIRSELKRNARAKHTSVGQLVRAAVEAYLPQLESSAAGQLEMPVPHIELPEEEHAPAEAKPPARRKRPARKAAPKKVRPAKAKKPVPSKRVRPTKSASAKRGKR